MRLKFQPQAVHDLEGIGAYIAADNPDRAVTLYPAAAQSLSPNRAEPSGLSLTI